MTTVAPADIRLDQGAFDLFAQACSALSPEGVQAELRNLYLDDVQGEAESLGDSVRPRLEEEIPLTVPQQTQLRRQLASGERRTSLLAAWKLLRAVDYACGGFSLHSTRFAMPGRLFERIELDGKLNTVAAGLVLPKGCPTPVSDNLVLKASLNLTWVPQDPEGYQVDYDFMGRHLTRTGGAPGRRSSFGFVRVAKDRDDLTVVSRDGRYSVGPNPAKEAELQRRMEEGVKALAERGADVIVLPESVMSDAMLDAVQATLRDLREGLNPIVIAGTRTVPNGGDRPRSRCTAVAMRGRHAWHQDKLHSYDIPVATIDAWGMKGILIPDAQGYSREDIAPEAARIAVRDTSVGRIVILVCQDLSVGGRLIGLLEQLTPTFVVVPVLDESAGAFWQRAGAAFRAGFTGGTFVCNSHFIDATQRAAQKRKPEDPLPPYVFYNVRLPAWNLGPLTNEKEVGSEYYIIN